MEEYRGERRFCQAGRQELTACIRLVNQVHHYHHTIDTDAQIIQYSYSLTYVNLTLQKVLLGSANSTM
jgi:hypothetical protein